jgi:hypothetical protein
VTDNVSRRGAIACRAGVTTIRRAAIAFAPEGNDSPTVGMISQRLGRTSRRSDSHSEPRGIFPGSHFNTSLQQTFRFERATSSPRSTGMSDSTAAAPHRLS